jgi:membrane protein DedA with SNARE-associated domain
MRRDTCMNDFIDQVRVFIETNQEWAGPVTALLTLGESLLVVGLFVPATALMLITGGLVGTGTLDGWTILVWGVGGAVIGDALSYVLGRWMGPGVLRRWPLNRQRSAVARARLFFRRYGFASVLAGRFLGPIRSTIPAVAGIMGMSHMRFQLANVLSAVAWMPLMLAPGFLTARSMGDAAIDGQLLMLAGVAFSIFLGVWLLCAVMRKRKNPATLRRARQRQEQPWP